MSDRFHAFGPVRTLSGRIDEWYIRMHDRVRGGEGGGASYELSRPLRRGWWRWVAYVVVGGALTIANHDRPLPDKRPTRVVVVIVIIVVIVVVIIVSVVIVIVPPLVHLGTTACCCGRGSRNRRRRSRKECCAAGVWVGVLLELLDLVSLL